MANKITSEILEDSTFKGSRLTTYLVNVPKFIIAEISKHRVLSMSVASSRAVKTESLIAMMDYIPTFWGKNESGMQASKELTPSNKELAKECYHKTKLEVAEKATCLNNLGVSKQTVNRLIENFCHVKCLITGTEFYNFFNLRSEYNAEPNLCYLATIMLEQYLSNKPKPLEAGQWHIAMIKESEKDCSIEEKLVKSAARCARTSYNNFYGKDDYPADLRLWNQLKTNGHWSTMEHQAQATKKLEEHYYSNFTKEWKQQRKLYETYYYLDFYKKLGNGIDFNKRLEEMKELCISRGFSF